MTFPGLLQHTLTLTQAVKIELCNYVKRMGVMIACLPDNIILQTDRWNDDLHTAWWSRNVHVTSRRRSTDHAVKMNTSKGFSPPFTFSLGNSSPFCVIFVTLVASSVFPSALEEWKSLSPEESDTINLILIIGSDVVSSVASYSLCHYGKLFWRTIILKFSQKSENLDNWSKEIILATVEIRHCFLTEDLWQEWYHSRFFCIFV